MKKLTYKIFYNLLLTLLTISFFYSEGYAGVKKDEVIFHEIFHTWTKAFNAKKYPAVCELFSESITASYQGSPDKNYSKMCEGFKKIFQEKDMVYHNDFKIHQIVRSNNLAMVRITWYLNVYKQGKHISFTQEEGLDVFQKQANGRWKIINFIAYPIPH